MGQGTRLNGELEKPAVTSQLEAQVRQSNLRIHQDTCAKARLRLRAARPVKSLERYRGRHLRSMLLLRPGYRPGNANHDMNPPIEGADSAYARGNASLPGEVNGTKTSTLKFDRKANVPPARPVIPLTRLSGYLQDVGANPRGIFVYNRDLLSRGCLRGPTPRVQVPRPRRVQDLSRSPICSGAVR